jgi:hypothetical protein
MSAEAGHSAVEKHSSQIGLCGFEQVFKIGHFE